jgi:type IX secretion system PorP/SprF family membrane protein
LAGLKRLFYILLLLIPCKAIQAQQLPLYSQYLYNKFLINPAVAGSDGYTSFNLTAREQWVGLAGAPSTFSFSGQTRLLKKSYIVKQTRVKKAFRRPKSDGKIGIGGFVFSDKGGLVQRTGFQASYAYHLWLQNSTQLSMGLAFTGYHFKINTKEINFEDPNDPLLNSDLRKGVFVPDASCGVYLLNAKYSIGFSADQLFQAVAKIGSDAYGRFKMSRQYYLFGSYNFERGPYEEIQPSVLFKMTEQFKPQIDLGLTYINNQAFWVGLAYRTSGALIANIGVKYQKMFLGYSIDFTLQQIQRITYGTHEITVAIKFGDSARRYRWLDRY